MAPHIPFIGSRHAARARDRADRCICCGPRSASRSGRADSARAISRRSPAGVLAMTTGVLDASALRGSLPALAYVPWIAWAASNAALRDARRVLVGIDRRARLCRARCARSSARKLAVDRRLDQHAASTFGDSPLAVWPRDRRAAMDARARRGDRDRGRARSRRCRSRASRALRAGPARRGRRRSAARTHGFRRCTSARRCSRSPPSVSRRAGFAILVQRARDCGVCRRPRRMAGVLGAPEQSSRGARARRRRASPPIGPRRAHRPSRAEPRSPSRRARCSR